LPRRIRRKEGVGERDGEEEMGKKRRERRDGN
jgi:hypothetical protein